VLFTLSIVCTVLWVGFSIWVSAGWREELEQAIGPIAGWVIPTLMAYIPGLVIWFMVFTLVFARHHELPVEPPAGPWPSGEWPPITVIVAAWNEEDVIAATLGRLALTRYPGSVEAVLADNNSTYRTAELAAEAADRTGLAYRRVFEPEPGKFHALNSALETVTTPIVVTLDADTFVHPDALTHLVLRVTDRPQDQHVCACAGALIVENASVNMLTRMQQWDYRLGINGVKRMQSTYNSALVAQGAFSAYWTDDVRAVGGWPDAIGEDIVLTWTMMGTRGLVCYEPTALSATGVPTDYGHFMRQRSRWARGMFEGIVTNPPHRQPRVLSKIVAGIDYLVPLLDIGFIFFWIPGLILALLGYPLLVSWISMLLIPITIVIFNALRRWQVHHVLDKAGIRLPPDRRGFWTFLFCYQALLSSASLRGYGQYVLGSGRRWK
jgi:biofilm PGA synthesis N-glycosyltransferase PgaC